LRAATKKAIVPAAGVETLALRLQKGWCRMIRVQISRMLIACLMLMSIAGARVARSEPSVDPYAAETKAERDARMQWWREARFGMFIHWGVYSVPAGTYDGRRIDGIGEWIMFNGKVPVARYREYAKQFNPAKYDPEQWVRLAKDAGMKYIVITSKHHDGFALFDSQASDWNVVKATPHGRDLLKPLAEACRKHGMKLGFYYSQAQDWNNKGGGVCGEHWDKAQDGDMDEYLRRVAVPQVREILSNYGPVSMLWWDTPCGMTRERAERLLPLLKLQPGIVHNNRLGGGYTGDTDTPEQEIPATGIAGRDWETCMTMNDTWGFKSYDANWKSVDTLLRNLVDIASKGGNYLLNVGPTSEGLIPEPSVERLQAIGRWMLTNGEAIHGTIASPFQTLPWGRCTRKALEGGTRLYFHVFDWPKDGRLAVAGLFNQPRRAYLLHDASQAALPVNRAEDALVISVPAQPPEAPVSVVALEIEGAPDVADPPRIEAEFGSFVDALEVRTLSPREDVEVRYSLDGGDPVAASPKAEAPIRLTQTTTLSARCFRNGKPVSGIARKRFERVVPKAAENVSAASPGLRYAYFEGEWDLLPDFADLAPLTQGESAGFDLVKKRRNDRFGFVYEGFVRVPKDGLYVFFTESDDGSRLAIDEQQVVLNDGLHAMQERQGEIALAAGLHRLRVEFFEKTGEEGLRVFYKGPGIAKQPIPSDALSH
jgi:alpha-L-fucosidase